jgi:hypothetical protein
MITGTIATWFLVLGLFLPRLALFVAWCGNQIPPNNIPFFGDFLMAAFLPRILMLIYIVINLGIGGWFVAHLCMFIFSILAGIGARLAKS